jgi:hypothetical protein
MKKNFTEQAKIFSEQYGLSSEAVTELQTLLTEAWTAGFSEWLGTEGLSEWEKELGRIERTELSELAHDELKSLRRYVRWILCRSSHAELEGRITREQANNIGRRCVQVLKSVREEEKEHRCDTDRKPSTGIRKILAKPRWLRP